MKLLSEVIDMNLGEKENLGLPSYINSILPVGQKLIAKGGPPVVPKQDKWSVQKDPARLIRAFEFKDPRILSAFLIEVIDYEEIMAHHGEITINKLDVQVKIWTRDLDKVTTLDLEYAEAIDEIFLDVRRYFRTSM